MDKLELTASVVSSLAVPGTLYALARLFKPQVASILEQITELEAFGMKAKRVQRSLEKAEQKQEEIELKNITKSLIENKPTPQAEMQEENNSKTSDQLDSPDKYPPIEWFKPSKFVPPEYRIASAWHWLHKTLIYVAARNGYHFPPNMKTIPTPRNQDLARFLGFSDAQITQIEELNKIRANTNHGSVSDSDAQRYEDIILSLEQTLKEIERKRIEQLSKEKLENNPQ